MPREDERKLPDDTFLTDALLGVLRCDDTDEDVRAARCAKYEAQEAEGDQHRPEE